MKSIVCMANIGIMLLLCSCNVYKQAQTYEQHDSFVRAYHRVRPSLVLLTVTLAVEHTVRSDDDDEQYGSGVIIASTAYGSTVLTARHVVTHARRILATLADGRVVSGRIIGLDSRADAALLHINTPLLPALALGRSARLEAGDPIGLAGFPVPDAFEDEHYGYAASVYFGRVASVRPGLLEVQLPVIPGESGAPIFDPVDGTVLALADARLDDERSIGFALPIDRIKPWARRFVRSLR